MSQTPTPPTVWPAALFRAPVLRGLDARGVSDVTQYGRLVKLVPGAVLFEPGQPSDSLFFVVEGVLELRMLARGDAVESVLREVGQYGMLGEEAVVPGLKRAVRAVCKSAAELCEIPLTVLDRALARAGDRTALEREMRQLFRDATRDLLRAQAFARSLGDDDLELLLDAVHYRNYESGAFIYRQGERAEHCLLLHKGLVQLQSERQGRVRVHGYLSSGDFYGDEELLSGESHRFSSVALGPSVVIHASASAMRGLCDRNPGLVKRLRRLSVARQQGQALLSQGDFGSTQHVLKDAYRMQMARSLLAIDQNSCVRCGHCAWACAEVHDGVSRLIRSGDKILVPEADSSGALQNLLLPNTCQHCEHPACMIDCPTGAIGRDPEGEVFIRPEICTGCGACAKACPWQNIQMAPLPAPERRPEQRAVDPAAPAFTAVKCDLCRELSAPACVQACPTDAVQRLDPSQDFQSVRALFGSSPARADLVVPGAAASTARRVMPLVASGVVLVGLVALTPFEPGRAASAMLVSGTVAAVGVVLLSAHALVKRGVRLWVRPRAPRGLRELGHGRDRARSVLSPWVRAHQSVGLVTLGAAVWHAGPGWPSGLSLALYVVFLASASSGLFGALSYRLLPRRLARLESQGALPEELGAAHALLVDRLYQQTSGQSPLVKKISERILLPYAKDPLASLRLLLSGRDLEQERRRLRDIVDQRLEGRGGDRLAGLDDLIKTVVDLRAWPLRRLLTAGLRGWQPLHAVLTLTLLILTLWHVLVEVGR